MSEAIYTNDNFLSQIYDKITETIGGNSPNQFLCLQLPGTILQKEDYEYDYKSHIKPRQIEANESRLANKMFDPCKVTVSDNGMTLAYQYKSALDILTPKLNAQISEIKNYLRKLLLTNYPYDFGDGLQTDLTLQEVYFRLYDDYLRAVEAWAKKQEDKKAELREKYKSEDLFNQHYLEWYDNTADLTLLQLSKKKAKVLSVFTPNDMKALEGILDSGCGAELQEARERINYVRKAMPNGSYVYPVQFKPDNWFESIGTKFNENDLLSSLEDLCAKYDENIARRNKIRSSIRGIAKVLSIDTKVASIQRVLSNMIEFTQRLQDSGDTATVDAFQETGKEKAEQILNEYKQKTSLVGQETNGKETSSEDKAHQNELGKAKNNLIQKIVKLSFDADYLSKEISLIDDCKTIGMEILEHPTYLVELVDSILKEQKECIAIFSNRMLVDLEISITHNKTKNDLSVYIESAKEASEKIFGALIEALSEAIQNHHESTFIDENGVEQTKKNSEFKTLRSSVKILRDQWLQTNNNIADTIQQMQKKMALDYDYVEDTSIKSLIDTNVPDGFTQVLMDIKGNSLIEDIKEPLTEEKKFYTITRAFSRGLNVLFLNESKKISQESNFYKNLTKENTHIQISMNVAKVSIERDWFNPGVFALTKDMLRLNKIQIAPNKTYNEISDERLEKMNECLFPCYPVSMLVARDVTIRFNYEKATEEDYEIIRKHAAAGGSFLLFSGSCNNSTSFTKSSVHSSFSDNSITLKFDSTQLLGYYLQATAPDFSTLYTSNDDSSDAALSTTSDIFLTEEPNTNDATEPPPSTNEPSENSDANTTSNSSPAPRHYPRPSTFPKTKTNNGAFIGDFINDYVKIITDIKEEREVSSLKSATDKALLREIEARKITLNDAILH